MKLRLLTRTDVQSAISMADAIEAVRHAYVQLSAGKAAVPLRTQVPIDARSGVTLFMPGYLPSAGALGAKIVSIFPLNRELGLPVIHAVVVLVDAATGRPAAVMDGTFLTALRTGAASGVSTDLLSRADTRVAAIFGAGVQGRTQLEAVCTVRKIERAWIYDTSLQAAEAYAAEMRARGHPIPPDIRVAVSSAQAVREADVVCTATTSVSPVFEDHDLKPGVHISAVGAYTPEMQEIPAATVARAAVVVDSRPACEAEAGDLIIPLRQGVIDTSWIRGEIGEVAAGRLPGRRSDTEITLFKSVGLSIQDMAVAEVVLRRAAERDLGIQLEL